MTNVKYVDILMCPNSPFWINRKLQLKKQHRIQRDFIICQRFYLNSEQFYKCKLFKKKNKTNEVHRCVELIIYFSKFAFIIAWISENPLNLSMVKILWHYL